MSHLARKLSLLAALILVANLLLLASLPYEWGEVRIRRKLDHVLERRGEYNTLFVGSSRVYRHLIPSVFDSIASGTTRSFNLGVQSYGFPRSATLVEHLLRTERHGIETIVMELSPPQIDPADSNLHTPEVLYWYTPSHVLLLLKVVAELPLRPRQTVGLWRRHVVSTAERHLNAGLGPAIITAWYQSLRPSRGNRGDDDAGFLSLDRQLTGGGRGVLAARRVEFGVAPRVLTERARSAVRVLEAPSSWTYSPTLHRAYARVLDLAAEQGVEIVLVLPPRLTARQYRMLLPVFERLPGGNRLDLADPRRWPAFYAPEYSFDAGHLNEAGARLFTEAVATKVRE